MSYKGKTGIGNDEPYAVSIYESYVKGDFPVPPPPATNVYSTEEDSGIKKVYVTDDGKAFAIV